MSAQQKQIDRRYDERDDCLMSAAVEIDGKRSFCMIRDISEKGAKLFFEPAQRVPQLFTLYLHHLPGIDEARRCELRWRVGNVVGVRFIVRTMSGRDSLPTFGKRS